jgi:hypothetical protein
MAALVAPLLAARHLRVCVRQWLMLLHGQKIQAVALHALAVSCKPFSGLQQQVPRLAGQPEWGVAHVLVAVKDVCMFCVAAKNSICASMAELWGVGLLAATQQQLQSICMLEHSHATAMDACPRTVDCSRSAVIRMLCSAMTAPARAHAEACACNRMQGCMLWHVSSLCLLLG